MTRLWWVRHAPTHSRAFAGWRDIPADLSDAAAIARLDAFLPRGAALISSDLARAVSTAAAVVQGRDLLPPDPRLREFHFGEWDGLDHASVSERWPDLSRAYWTDPTHIAPPNGETWTQAEARVNAAVADILTAHRGRDIIIAAHFGTILTQYARAAGLNAPQALAQRIDNLSVTRIAVGDDWRLECVNHLA